MKTFSRNIKALYGVEGEIWLNNLPKFLQKIEKKLHLTLVKPFENLTFNYVTSVKTEDGLHKKEI